MNIFLIISSIFFGLLAFGFLVGFLRNWCRALIRLGILIGDFIISLLISPLITNAVIGKVTTGSTIDIFGFSFDLTEYLNQIVGTDLDSVIDTTTAMSVAVAKILVNILLFIAIFIIIGLVSLLIYWVALIIYKKLSKAEKSADTKLQKTIGLRLLGGFEGMVSMLVICFTLLVPFFGVFEVMDKAVVETSKSDEAVASAFNGQNFICGELYYTEDEKIGHVEGVIEQYSVYKAKFDKSFMGVVFSITGLNKLGATSFKRLSNVEIDNEKIDFSAEISTIIEAYDVYKDSFLKNKFDINDDTSIENIEKIYTTLTKSTFIQKYIVDILPTASEKWSAGEKFLGIELPVPEEYSMIVKDAFNVFAYGNFGVVDDNIKVLFEVAKIARDEKLISCIMEKQDLIEYVMNNENVVKEIVIALSKTQEFQDVLPKIMVDALDVAYKQVVGDENFDKTNTYDKNSVNWEVEADTISKLSSTLAGLYKNLVSVESENLTEEVVNANLGTVGKLIDLSRASQTINQPLKSFIVSYISSENISFGENNEAVKTKILNLIEEKWDLSQNPNFSFELTLSALGETALIAENLTNGKEIDFSKFETSINSIISNSEVKNVLFDFISDGLIYDMIGISNESYVLNNMLERIITDSTAETVSKDILGAKAVLDILSLNSSSELSEEEIGLLVSDFTNSNVITDLIMELTEDESKPLSEIAKNMSDEHKMMVLEKINTIENLTDLQKEAILSIFC